MTEPSNLLKVTEAAEAFGVSERTIHNWIRDGQLPAVQPGGRGHSVVAQHHNLASRSDFRKPMLSLADKLLKSADGQTAADLQVARDHVEAIGR